MATATMITNKRNRWASNGGMPLHVPTKSAPARKHSRTKTTAMPRATSTKPSYKWNPPKSPTNYAVRHIFARGSRDGRAAFSGGASSIWTIRGARRDISSSRALRRRGRGGMVRPKQGHIKMPLIIGCRRSILMIHIGHLCDRRCT